jgi:hypothetical protein
MYRRVRTNADLCAGISVFCSHISILVTSDDVPRPNYSIIKSVHSFIQWIYGPLLDPGHFVTFVIIVTLTAALLGRMTNQSQGRYLHMGQYKQRINTQTNIRALSRIRTHDRAREDSSCFRLRSHCDRPLSQNRQIFQ